MRKSTIVDNRNGRNMDIVKQEYEKYGRIKPLVLDDTQGNQLSKGGRLVIEQKKIKLEMFKRELEKKDKEMHKMMVMDSLIKQHKNNMELKFQYIMHKTLSQNQWENKEQLQRIDKLKYISQLNHIINKFKEQCY